MGGRVTKPLLDKKVDFSGGTSKLPLIGKCFFYFCLWKTSFPERAGGKSELQLHTLVTEKGVWMSDMATGKAGNGTEMHGNRIRKRE